MKHNYKIVFRYDGSRYDGWQKQGNTSNTIQGRIEAVLEKMTGEPVEIAGSGRTDAGVHAYGQVANFHMTREMDTDTIKQYLNEYLPQDIRAVSAEKADPRFHSRLNAVSKEYLYVIDNGETADPFRRRYAYHHPEPLNLNRMRRAAEYLIGEHDFKSFCSNKKMKKSSVRTIYEIDIDRKDAEIHIRIRGNGFLYNMVRIIAGTLIEVGKGQREPSDMKKIIGMKDRAYAGPMAPAQGLFLVKVDYENQEGRESE